MRYTNVLTVKLTVMGVSCLGLIGGPAFKHNEAFSFQVATDDQPKRIACGTQLSRPEEVALIN